MIKLKYLAGTGAISEIAVLNRYCLPCKRFLVLHNELLSICITSAGNGFTTGNIFGSFEYVKTVQHLIGLDSLSYRNGFRYEQFIICCTGYSFCISRKGADVTQETSQRQTNGNFRHRLGITQNVLRNLLDYIEGGIRKSSLPFLKRLTLKDRYRIGNCK